MVRRYAYIAALGSFLSGVLLCQQHYQLVRAIGRLETAIELEHFLRTKPAECAGDTQKARELTIEFTRQFPITLAGFQPTAEDLIDQEINFGKRHRLNERLASWIGLVRVRALLLELQRDRSQEAVRIKQKLADCLCRAKQHNWFTCVQLLENAGVTLAHSTECDPEL